MCPPHAVLPVSHHPKASESGTSLVHRIPEEARMEYWFPASKLTCTIHSWPVWGTERLVCKGLMHAWLLCRNTEASGLVLKLE